MQYRCGACDTTQWRGFFPQATFHIRYAVFHGIALGICGTTTKLLFAHFGHETSGWRNGLSSLGVCAVLLLVAYVVAILAEGQTIARRPCQACGQQRLRRM